MAVCPECGAEGVPIIYGMPGFDLFEDKQAGRVVLAGCVVCERDPNWACRGPVQHRWVEDKADERVHLVVELDWVPLGPVFMTSGELDFPRAVPDEPGIYRFTLSCGDNQSVYIGEAVRLFRRFAQYREPGPTQRTNQCINRLMKEVLEASGSVFVDIATEVQVGDEEADLSYRPYRLLAENAALIATRNAGIRAENL
jgi:hypothetical protein